MLMWIASTLSDESMPKPQCREAVPVAALCDVPVIARRRGRHMSPAGLSSNPGERTPNPDDLPCPAPWPSRPPLLHSPLIPWASVSAGPRSQRAWSPSRSAGLGADSQCLTVAYGGRTAAG